MGKFHLLLFFFTSVCRPLSSSTFDQNPQPPNLLPSTTSLNPFQNTSEPIKTRTYPLSKLPSVIFTPALLAFFALVDWAAAKPHQSSVALS